MKKVVVITGPTAVGKTKISIEVAKLLDGEIISADSAQVYKGLDIGTAKIKEDEKEGIKHHLIDIIKPDETYDVKRFQDDTRALIEKLDYPIIVGGTGLYIKAALYDYDFSDSGRDLKFEKKHEKYNNEELFKLLEEKDYKLSLTTHKNNRRRVLRLLSDHQKEVKKNKDVPLYDIKVFELTLPREKLYERINKRVDIMLDEGLLEEVKALKELGHTFNILCYKEMNEYLDNNLTYDESVELLKKNTRRYAKRQLTWFRHQMDTTVIDVSDIDLALNKIKEEIHKFYEGI